ncbi:Ig-like domain repeat protein [Methanobrevibacter sp.]|uniref:Ig-like domain repeat protein n=1 Tax=Methanobrevibacter sp. TaxID=66852 RepID=UPI003865CB8D
MGTAYYTIKVVVKALTEITVKNSTVELIFGESFTINAATVPEGLNLTYVPDESGVVSVDENGTVTALKLGIAKILVKFNGNDTYAANSTVVTVKVKVDKIEIPPEEAFNFTSAGNGTEVISVNLPEVATGFVLLDINGTQTHVELVNGKANVSIPKLAEGTYNATVTYAGDDFYAPITTTKEINVTSNVPGSALSLPVSSKSDDSTIYSISLPGDAGGFLEVEVDGKIYSAPLSNGSASVTIPALSDGSHNVTVRYTGDGNYSPLTQKTTLNVSAPVFKLSNNKDVSALYSAKATYKVLVTRDGKAVGADEKVTFTYNGNTYTVRTDKNGYATLNLKTNLKVNKYTITAEYKGVKVTNKVTVNNIINAKNKKVKKSRKVTKVKVSLKKVNGEYLKDKVIKIKFKGKTYKLITNKKGVAT